MAQLDLNVNLKEISNLRDEIKRIENLKLRVDDKNQLEKLTKEATLLRSKLDGLVETTMANMGKSISRITQNWGLTFEELDEQFRSLGEMMGDLFQTDNVESINEKLKTQIALVEELSKKYESKRQTYGDSDAEVQRTKKSLDDAIDVQIAYEKILEGVSRQFENNQKAIETTKEQNYQFQQMGETLVAIGGSDALLKLQKETKNATEEAKVAKQQYESLKESLPYGSNDAKLAEYEKKMKDTASVANEFSQKLEGAQRKANELGDSIDDNIKGLNGLSKSLQKSLGGVIDWTKNNKTMQAVISALPQPLQQATNGFLAMGKACLAFVASPIGLVLGAIVASLKAVDYALNTTAKGYDDLDAKQRNLISLKSYGTGYWDAMTDRIGLFGDALVGLLNLDVSAFGESMWELAKSVSNPFALAEDVISKSRIAEQIGNKEKDLHDERLKWSTQEVEIDAKVADARAKMYESTDQTKRLEQIKIAREAINEKYAKQIEFAEEELKIEELRGEKSRNDQEHREKMVELTNKKIQLERQAHQEQMMFIRQETAARKALLQEEINQSYEDRERDIKESKEKNALRKDTHRKNLEAIQLDNDAQRIALAKKREQDLAKLDKDNVKERLHIEEEYAKDVAHLDEMLKLKAENENKEFYKRTSKEVRDNELSIAKEQVEVSTDANEAIIRQIKKRYGISETETNKAIIQIELERQASINSLDDQIAKWKELGEWNAKNRQWAEERRAQIEAETAKKREDTNRELSNSLVEEQKKITELQGKNEENLLSHKLSNIDAEKDANKRALDEQIRQSRELYGTKADELVKLYEKQKELIDENAEYEKTRLLKETYQTLGDRFTKAEATYDKNKQTLRDNGMTAEADEAQRQEDEELGSIGVEYLERNKEQYGAWMKSVGDMTRKELVELSAQLKGEYDDLKKEGNGTTEQFMKLKGQIHLVTKALDKKNGEAVSDFTEKWKEERKGYSALMKEVSKLGDTIGGVEGEILNTMSEIGEMGISMVDDISTLTQSTMSGVEATSKASAEAIKGVERASVILAIIGVALQIIMKISSMLKTTDDKYKEYADKQAEINKLTTSVNAYQMAVLRAKQAEENWFNSTGLKNYSDSFERASKARENYFAKANEMQEEYKNQESGGWLKKVVQVGTLPITKAMEGTQKLIENVTGTDGVMQNFVNDMAKKLDFTGAVSSNMEQYVSKQKAAIENLRIETKKAEKGFLGTGIGGKKQKTQDLREWARENMDGAELFDENNMVNSQLAQRIIEDYGDKLQGETKATLEELIKQKEEYDEAMEEMRNYVSDMYSPIVDNMTDSLMTWLDTGEDVMDSFQNYASDTFRNIAKDMIKTMIQRTLFGQYEKDINKLYEEYANDNDMNKLAKGIANATGDLMDNFERNADTIKQMTQDVANQLKESGIDITGNGDEQKATFGGYETMSEQTGTELSGRFSAMYIVQSDLLNVAREQSVGIMDMQGLLADMQNRCTDLYAVNISIEELIANSYIQLQQISDNTGVMMKVMQSVDERMERWNTHIMNL